MRKYELPSFLAGTVTQVAYDKWLRAKSQAHFRRDRKRGNQAISNESYKIAIHRAVVDSKGFDEYTGETLDWKLIGKYNNIESQRGRRLYKFALLPTIDHCGDGLGEADFKICSYRTNDAKHDLSYSDFVALCRRVVTHAKSRALSADKTGAS